MYGSLAVGSWALEVCVHPALPNDAVRVPVDAREVCVCLLEVERDAISHLRCAAGDLRLSELEARRQRNAGATRVPGDLVSKWSNGLAHHAVHTHCRGPVF